MGRNSRNWRTNSGNSRLPTRHGGLVEVADTNDRVVLSAPRGNLALSAMRVVVGWLASCHDLPLDRLDDVNLAIETLLAEEADEGGALSLTLSVEAGVFDVMLDGLENRDLKSTLVATEPFKPSQGCPLDVSLFLNALVDDYRVVPGGARAFGVRMQKRIA
jgi:hypothetical protein